MGGGLGYIFGGLAQGLGQGMVQRAQYGLQEQLDARRAEMQQRFEMIKEDARAKSRLAEIDRQGEVEVKTTAGKLAAQEPYSIADDERTAKREKDNDDRQHRNRLSEIGAEGSKQERLARLQAGLSASNTRASTLLEQQLRAGDVADTFQGDDGLTYIIKKDGTTQSTGVKFNTRAKARADTGEDGYGLPSAAAPATAQKFVRDPKTGKIVPVDRPPLSSFQR